MIGNNKIYINQATMQEAIKLWLADQFKNPPLVDSVKKNNDNGARDGDGFIIEVTTIAPHKNPDLTTGR